MSWNLGKKIRYFWTETCYSYSFGFVWHAWLECSTLAVAAQKRQQWNGTFPAHTPENTDPQQGTSWLQLYHSLQVACSFADGDSNSLHKNIQKCTSESYSN